EVVLVLGAAWGGGADAAGVSEGRARFLVAQRKSGGGSVDLFSMRRRSGDLPRRHGKGNQSLEALCRKRNVGHLAVGSGRLQDRVREPDRRARGHAVLRTARLIQPPLFFARTAAHG